jgi:DNA-binding response OmpR family regulator
MKQQLILVINDEPALSELLRSYIEDGGFRFSPATDWEEGRYLAGILKPDAILLNTSDRIGKGFEFCTLLHKDPATGNIPVIFIYAKDSMPKKRGLHLVRAQNYISLPVERESLLETVRDLIGGPPSAGDELPSMPAHILLAEDDRVIMEFITAALEEEGYKVTNASSGMEALEKAMKLKPDAMILNIMLPDADGIEVCELLLSDPGTAGIPIILESAKKDMKTISKGFRAGAKNYLVKPFTPDELVAALRDVVGKKRD